jgi:hypothetical protein
MKLVADSKDYSSDKRALSFALLFCFALPLMFAPLYLLVAPGALNVPKQAIFALLLGGIALIVFLGVYLKGKGILFKVPLKAFAEGLLIQPAMGFRPLVVPYEDVASIELWCGSAGRINAGCAILSGKHGSIKSVENFTDGNSLKAFAERIGPALEDAGFRTESAEEGASSARYVFRKALRLGL